MGTTPTNSISSEALSNFLAGVEEKMQTNFGLIASLSEKKEAKRKIAQEQELEDSYERGPDESWTTWLDIEARYQDLLESGEIREDPDWDDPRHKWNEEINSYLEGEGDTPFDNVDNEL
jgi:hypothetical protein